MREERASGGNALQNLVKSPFSFEGTSKNVRMKYALHQLSPAVVPFVPASLDGLGPFHDQI